MNINLLQLEAHWVNKATWLSVFDMVEDICSQVNQLDAPRQYMFMEWLLIHCHNLHRDSELHASLIAWLNSMSRESAIWEYELITGETQWWRDQDEPRLLNLMLECLRNS